MHFTLPSTVLLLAASMLSFSNALPVTTPTVRAGGPAAVPIPSNCTVTNLVPTLGQMRNQTYIPASSANNDILYSAYYPSYSSNTTRMSLHCLQQCHGYGGGDQCKTAFWAEEMVVPEGYYGSPGGQLETACLFFNRTLEESDFAIAPKGQASNAVAWSVVC